MLRSLILIVLIAQSVGAQPMLVDDFFAPKPRDQMKRLGAAIISFDGPDDGVALGVPEWVSYKMLALEEEIPVDSRRPSRWFTDRALARAGIAPYDDSYTHSGYARGHMYPKIHAQRLSYESGKPTHNVLNACPQLQPFNNGIWFQLENLCADWADEYEELWVICGPVFLQDFYWAIGDEGEMPVAIPDAFYKIVARERGDGWVLTMAFIFPHTEKLKGRKHNLTPYLTSIDIVEALTGLDFFTNLDDEVEQEIEMVFNQV